MAINATAATGFGLALILLALFVRWKWRSFGKNSAQAQPASASTHLVHRLCPHNNVVQEIPLDQKDSLDEHLDQLTKKLAEKEGRLRLSKSRIRETQNEIENLHAIDQDVRLKYRSIMDSLRTDLRSNEKECRRLQDQIEWVSRRRAELKEEVRRGHKMYGEAAADLATNLVDLQKGRVIPRVIYPSERPPCAVRHRKEPQLPRSDFGRPGSVTSKTPPCQSPSTPQSLSHIMPHSVSHTIRTE